MPDWVAYETEQLGRDHAGYSAMLLKSWNLPERICKTVEASHEPQKLDATTDEGRFARCVALWQRSRRGRGRNRARATSVASLAQRADKLLGMNSETFAEVVTRVLNLIPETEALYETSIIDSDDAENPHGRARELLAVRNLHALQEVSALQATTACC
jgi:hypothetical protein